MPSPPPSPAAVRLVRKRLADGTVKVYEYPRAAPKLAKPAPMPADSLRELLIAYERSPEWSALAHRTRKNRLIALRHLHAIQHLAVPSLRRRDILTLRDAIAQGIGAGAANAFASALSAVLAWAVDREWIEANPAARIRALPGGHFPTWAEEDLTAALRVAPEDLRRALILAVHTGQRRGDLCAMRWTDLAGGVIRLTQEKTGRRLAIPLHAELAAELAKWRRDRRGLTLLAREDGVPMNRDTLTMAVMRLAERIGRKGLNMHGLRKLAAVRLAQAGCSALEIAAITGHVSLSQVALYTADADQERLAKAAVTRLHAAARQLRKPRG